MCRPARPTPTRSCCASSTSASARRCLQGQPRRLLHRRPHYDGHPSVLVRLEAVDPSELAELLEEAWRLRAPEAPRRRVRRGALTAADRGLSGVSALLTRRCEGRRRWCRPSSNRKEVPSMSNTIAKGLMAVAAVGALALGGSALAGAAGQSTHHAGLDRPGLPRRGYSAPAAAQRQRARSQQGRARRPQRPARDAAHGRHRRQGQGRGAGQGPRRDGRARRDRRRPRLAATRRTCASPTARSSRCSSTRASR